MFTEVLVRRKIILAFDRELVIAEKTRLLVVLRRIFFAPLTSDDLSYVN